MISPVGIRIAIAVKCLLTLNLICGAAVRFDDVPGTSDVDKLLNLPAIIQSNIETIGTRYSLGGGWPQPGILNTVVRVVFSNRVHDFQGVSEPVDMGHCFALVGEGRPIFECGPNGFIRFAQRKTLICDITFVGPRDNVPPLIIYSSGEPAQWVPGGGQAPLGEPLAWGREADAGDIRLLRCYFKGFDVVLRTRRDQHTNSAYFRIADCTFNNCVQLTDNLMIDGCLIEDCWFYPTLESNKAFIVNQDVVLLRNVFAQARFDGAVPSQARWFDNHCIVDVRNSYFSSRSGAGCQPVSLVYHYKAYGSTAVFGIADPIEADTDRYALIVKDNVLDLGHTPVVKFYEVPNHIIMTGNTLLSGTDVESGVEYEGSFLCAVDGSMTLPGPEAAPYITFNIFDNNGAFRFSQEDPNYLPEPLCNFGPVRTGTVENPPCGVMGTVYIFGDFNKDCYVDVKDLALLAEFWLACTDPGNPACGPF